MSERSEFSRLAERTPVSRTAMGCGGAAPGRYG
ncbi:hypothetical protein BH18ACT3_BH18ACT3_13100 [soil metagenome]